ncbi:SEFIR domain-containing protein [Nocardia sp. NPDC059240]|uniref:SEFIR domain-containing protein n=1 Tax=Nocardia sp. NPDC059240 TaxID=3346786 RepID=UPI00368B16D3
MSIAESSGVGTTPVSVALQLDDGGTRKYFGAPSRISFGALQMRGWQIYPVRQGPGEFEGQDAYLVKINFDLMLEAEVPSPSWFEIGFALSVADADAVVIDAIPQYVLEPQPERSFALNRYLAFVPGDDVKLPATLPIVDLFGLGGPEVRWRYTTTGTGGVRPGNYTCWTTIAVPSGCPELTVDIHARFDLGVASEYARIYTPASEPARVVLALRESTPYAGQLDPLSDSGSAPNSPHVPRVFISYTHDDRDHSMAVLRFGEFLAADCGFDVHMDRWDLDVRRDWYLWAIEQITAADFVVIIASPGCKRVADGLVGNEENRGMQSEMSILMDRLNYDRETWRRKLLPVVLLPDRSIAEIPLFLQPGIGDYYLVSDLSIKGAEDLLRVITRSPVNAPPRRNPTVVVLPTRPAGS